MEMYLLKSAACLAVLMLFYRLLLEKESMHVFKRFYLLFSVGIALIIPFITFTTYTEPSAEVFNSVIISSEAVAEGDSMINYIPSLLIGIYALGVLFFSLKFLRNLKQLVLRIRKNPKIKQNDFTNVLLKEKIPPHTFFSFIFFNQQKYLHNKISRDVIIHEQAHARQKHSLDVLFVELLQIIFWFNPLIFLLKNAVKLNHEFLADQAVLRQGVSTAGYQQTLLTYSSGDLQSDLVNPINYSSIKKRFTVMKTKTSKRKFWARNFLLLPLLAGLVYGFSTKEVVEKKSNYENSPVTVQHNKIRELKVNNEGDIFLNNKKISLAEIEELDMEKYSNFFIDASPNAPKAVLDALVQIGLNSVPVKTVKVRSNGELPLNVDDVTPGKSSADSVQEKATPEMIAEYNELVKYYNELHDAKRRIKQEDVNRIMYIHSLMTPEQKQKAEKIKFDVPPPPPPAPVPSPAKTDVPPPPLTPVEVKGYPSPAAPPPPAPEPEAIRGEEALPVPPAPIYAKLVPFPPPPPPPSFEDLVEQGATFYYNGKKIEPAEARKLVEVDKKLNIQVSSINGKSVVRITDNNK